MKHLPTKLSCLAQLLVVFLSLGLSNVFAQTRQEHVHQMAPRVMPFDMSKTEHIFEMTQTGGVLRVIARDPGAADQVALIREHLQREAEKFQKGDFGDPASLHGGNMPGLKDLQAGAARIKTTYAELPSGAEITFLTPDLQLLTALHRWFGAQLSEHGSDARAE
ncbi:MAG: hypothetical protein WAL90_00970 [Desulfobacterales bacterium]